MPGGVPFSKELPFFWAEMAGIAVRGSALILLLMLIPFSLIVLHRALAIREASAIAFCAIQFDCGCGAGEVNICHKLLENSLLILLAALLFAFGPTDGVLGGGHRRSGSSERARRA